MNEDSIRIIYRSQARLCLAADGVVVHAEREPLPWAEARETGPGGPRSGRLVGRMTDSQWSVPPEDDAVRSLIQHALDIL